MLLELDAAWESLGLRAYRHAASGVHLYIDPTRGLPSGGRIDVIRESRIHTLTGWPVEWVERRISWPAGEVEHQLQARYHLFDAHPVVLMTGSSDRVAAQRSELEAILLSARPDPPDPASCLAQLLADVDE